MTERKRVLSSLLLLMLFAAQVTYTCTLHLHGPKQQSTTISAEEEIEEDPSGSSVEEDAEAHFDLNIAKSEYTFEIINISAVETITHLSSFPYFVHLDTPFSPPELVS